MNDRQRLETIVSVVCKYLPPDGISKDQAINEIIRLVDPLPEQEHGEPVAWQVEVYVDGAWSPMGNPNVTKSRAEALAGNPSIPKDCVRVVSLYTTPQQRKPLTVQEIAEFVGTHEYGAEQLKWFRLGEAAHGIKE